MPGAALKRGAFVTLTERGALRGCIGHIAADRELGAVVREMAIAAWRKATAEFIGAFTLIFIGAGAIIAGGNLLLVALAHGLAIGVMASAFARISGGHFNPATDSILNWQGATFTGLRVGTYTFTYNPLSLPTVEWHPINEIIREFREGTESPSRNPTTAGLDEAIRRRLPPKY